MISRKPDENNEYTLKMVYYHDGYTVNIEKYKNLKGLLDRVNSTSQDDKFRLRMPFREVTEYQNGNPVGRGTLMSLLEACLVYGLVGEDIERFLPIEIPEENNNGGH